jgi:uncharacterized protein (UPF0371 family)
MSDITLESLIQEHKDRIAQLKYKPNPHGCWGFSYYYYDDSESYQKWLATTKRFISIKYPNDKDVNEFESIGKEELGPEQQKRLLAILEAFAVLPTIIPDNKTDLEKNEKQKDGINVTTTINNTNSQSQKQEQSLAIDLFIDAIREDLTGRQIKELKSVVADADNDLQKARPGIITKLKEFGTDVASNIVANILTNPMIWGGL